MRKNLSWLLAVAMCGGMVPFKPLTTHATIVGDMGTEERLVTTGGAYDVTTSSQISILNADQLATAEYESAQRVGKFIVTASSSGKVVVDTGAKQVDGETITNRIKLGGTGKASARSIRFSTDGEATLTVYAISSSSSSDRKFDLRKITGPTDADYEVVDTKDIVGSSNVIKLEYQIKEAGEYYVGSQASGVNVYKMVLEEGETNTKPRKPWGEVQAPVIEEVTKNTSSKSTLDIKWSGDIGKDGADTIVAKLYDSLGKEVKKESTYTEGTEGTISLPYPASGKYTVQLEATRDGESEVKTSAVVETSDLLTDLPDSVTITSVLTGKNNSLNVKWNAIDEVEHYDVAYKVAGEGDDKYQPVATQIIDTNCNIPDLQVGTTYTIKVTGYRGVESVVGTIDKKVEQTEERWAIAQVGSGAAGQVTVNNDGSVTIDATGGKMADSEDGFSYYYTEIDPETENFTLTATFVMDNVDTRDNQSGFGIIAIDSLVPGVSGARYFNSAAAMFTKYSVNNNGVISSKYGFPGGRFITGYTGEPTDAGPAGSRKHVDSSVFDPNYREGELSEGDSKKPRFFTGDEYTLTLRKSNTGFHAYMSNDKTNEVICYEPELLLQQDQDKYYVGVFASRKIKVTVKDMQLDIIHPDQDEAKQERPMSYIDPALSYDATRTSSSTDYEAAFKTNIMGTIDIQDASGKTIVADIDAKNIDRSTANLVLKEGDNQFTAILTPSPREEQGLADTVDLSSYDPISINFTVSHQKYGTSENALYVAPNGSSNGKATKQSPLDIYTAIAYAQPGQQIVLTGGTYNLTQPLVIDRGNSGREGQPIVLMSDPNERAVLDFAQSSSGITLKGDYWHFYDLEICHAVKSPIRVNGHNNIIEKLSIHDNADTGLQISGFSTESKSMWPSNNLVLSCESYDNADELGNDADGFAAKLTVGEGNIFRYCIARNNIDDGWDLYAKSTSGSIGKVIVENSVTYENGYTTHDKTKVGEGNGFKLGGESMPGAHILRNSISFNNYAKGITSNSGPDCQLLNNISYGNGAENVSLYTNTAPTTNYVIQNVITSRGGKEDKYDFRNQDWINDGSVYINGTNGKGSTVTDAWFESVDMSIVPTIEADGSINMHGLLELTGVAEGEGAVFGPNPNPTVIEIGKEIEGDKKPNPGTSDDDFTSNNVGAGQSTPSASDIIKEALEQNITPQIQVDKTGEVELNTEVIDLLIQKEQNLVIVANSGIQIVLTPQNLKEQQNNLKVQATLPAAVTLNTIEKTFKGNEQIMPFASSELTLQLGLTTDQVVESFNEPITITFDLSNVKINEGDKLSAVQYVEQADGTLKAIKIGGTYDEATKTFTFITDAPGVFGVAKVDTLNQLVLAVNKNNVIVDGTTITNDVAPEITEDRVMLPIRFVVESLGGKIGWNEEEKAVTIEIEDQVLTFRVGETLEAYGVAPYVKEGRTFIPIRWVAEEINANVIWVPSSKKVQITK